MIHPCVVKDRFVTMAYSDGIVYTLDAFNNEVIEQQSLSYKHILIAIKLGESVLDFLRDPDVLLKQYKGFHIQRTNDGIYRIFFNKIKDIKLTAYICIAMSEMTFLDAKDCLDIGYWEFYL